MHGRAGGGGRIVWCCCCRGSVLRSVRAGGAGLSVPGIKPSSLLSLLFFLIWQKVEWERWVKRSISSSSSSPASKAKLDTYFSERKREKICGKWEGGAPGQKKNPGLDLQYSTDRKPVTPNEVAGSRLGSIVKSSAGCGTRNWTFFCCVHHYQHRTPPPNEFIKSENEK